MNPLLSRKPLETHGLIVGGSGLGKTSLLADQFFRTARAGFMATTCIDPHASLANAIIERCANPEHRLSRHSLRILNPGSSTHTFGCNPLETPGEPSDEAAHAAAHLVSAVIESAFDQAAEETPRLARIAYALCYICALRKLTLLEVVELATLSGQTLAERLLEVPYNAIARRELEDLHRLALEQPPRFLEQVESLKSRLVRWLGDPRLRRIVGQRRGFRPREVMDGRIDTVIDLSSLGPSGAKFLGTLLTSMFFSEGLKRIPDISAPHVVMIDEAESLLTADVARGLDQLRKFSCFFRLSVQRLGQLKRNPEIFDAVMNNTHFKLAMGVSDPEAAGYLAELFAMGHLAFNEWKPDTERPVAVGSDRVFVRSWEAARSHTESRSQALTAGESVGRASSLSRGAAVTKSDARSLSRARGITDSQSRSTSAGRSRGYSESESEASSMGTSTSDSFGTGITTGTSDHASLSLAPPAMNLFDAPPALRGADLSEWYAVAPQIDGMQISQGLSQSESTSASHSNGLSSMQTRGRGTTHSRAESASESESAGTARSESFAEGTIIGRASSYSVAEGVAYSQALSRAHTAGRAQAHGTSESEGRAEAFITRYQWLPSQTYSLQEQLARIQGELQSLNVRECFVKMHGEAPMRLRTPLVAPAFRSARYKRLIVPLYCDFCDRHNPYLLSIEEAEAAIAARRTELFPSERSQDPGAPEEFTLVDDPDAFARTFWAKRKPRRSGKPRLRIVKPDGDKEP